MSVRKYEFPDLNKKAAPAGASIRAYDEPKFEAHLNAKEVDTIHKKGESFHLDQMVVDQLKIEEREQAEKDAWMRKELERRWEQVSEKAEVSGYTKGLEEGRAEAFKAELPRVQEKIGKLERLLEDFDTYREKIFGANEGFLMELIAEVAGIIVLREVEVDKDYVRRLVLGLLQQLSAKEDIKIRLSEADYANVGELHHAIHKEFGKLQNTTIEASADIPVGGCKIETRFGVVDASIAAQIANVKAALRV